MGEGRTLAVGDRLDTDVAGAVKAGVDAALVLSGGTTADEVAALGAEDPHPIAVADDLASLALDRG
jgi:ribonucleotide monophosphatase NagD (HAD superfamily)